jgi:hypothetical protein
MNGDGSAAKRYTCSKLKLDSLFVQFFSLPETQQTVRNNRGSRLCPATLPL